MAPQIPVRRCTDDVRFVKRKFPIDGTRTIHPQLLSIAQLPQGKIDTTRNERFRKAFSRPLLRHTTTTATDPSHDDPSSNITKSPFFFKKNIAKQQHEELEDEPDSAAMLLYPVHGALERSANHSTAQLPDGSNGNVQNNDHQPPLYFDTDDVQPSSDPDPAMDSDKMFAPTPANLLLDDPASQECCDPDRTIDSDNLFASSSPNLPHDHHFDNNADEEVYLETGSLAGSGVSKSRRVTVAQPSDEPPSFNFYHEDCSPVALRPTRDPDVIDLLGDDDDDSENDDFEVLHSVKSSLPKRPCPPRPRSTIGPAKTHRDRFPISSHVRPPPVEDEPGRRPFRHLRSFLAKNRKRQANESNHCNRNNALSSATKKQKKQTSILSHFQIGST
jgi:hypothetical protein